MRAGGAEGTSQALIWGFPGVGVCVVCFWKRNNAGESGDPGVRRKEVRNEVNKQGHINVGSGHEAGFHSNYNRKKPIQGFL